MLLMTCTNSLEDETLPSHLPRADLVASLSSKLHCCSIESLESSEFVVGLYELNSESGAHRDGGLVICDWQSTYAHYSASIDGNIAPKLDQEVAIDVKEEIAIPCGGVLDCKINTRSSDTHNIIATALSSSKLQLYKRPKGTDEEQVTILSQEISKEEEGLFLSLCWDSINIDSNDDSQSCSRIAVSTQESSILVYDIDSTSTEPIIHMSDTHILMGTTVPAWITAFDVHTPHRLLSGGDDNTLKLWDLRAGYNESLCIAKNSKSHTAGVTSAEWHPYNTHAFATGSYDEYVRVWDDRNLKSPVVSLHVQGGVWRSKWMRPGTTNDSLILACMHSGCATVHLTSSTEPSDVTASVFAHDSNDNSTSTFDHAQETNRWPLSEQISEEHLSYGVDILGYANRDEGVLMAASCSFYENTVQLWALH